LMYDTHRTSALVADKLRAFGCDIVETGLGRTGVVGVIHGKVDTSGRVIGLRADMDGLPIHEISELPHRSKTPGAMHACGHDGHSAMLLGAAKYLAETRNFDGRAVVIFQPAEEGGAGAKEMCDDGLMERFAIQEIYGMHNWPGLPMGTFALRPGPFFAAVDMFEIEFEGKGTHAARPQAGIDTPVVAAQFVVAAQTIVSRNADPVDQFVVSVTSIETDTKAYNVIPQKVHLKGTVRAMDAAVQELAERRIAELAHGIAASFGAVANVRYERGSPVVINAPEQTRFAAGVAQDVAGACAEAPLVMAGEDFAFMLNERPGALILVGNGDSETLHHPGYEFNDEAIPAGCSWWAEIAEQSMPLRDR